MTDKRKAFRIVFEAESGLTDYIRVNDEAELARTLSAMLKGSWNRLIAGDTIHIVEETEND